MTVARPVVAHLDPRSAAHELVELGFLALADPDGRAGPASLLVAIRPKPTLRHFDPETVDYWVSQAGQGAARTLALRTRLPIGADFSWGPIRIVDRLGVANAYLTFGGRLTADVVDGTVVAVFDSPAPLLRRGGHSQGWDQGADSVGAFFSRFLLAVDYAPGFEGRLAQADPLSRYAAFVIDGLARYRASPAMRSDQPQEWTLLQAEEHRLGASNPDEWAAGEALRQTISGAAA